MGDFNAQVGNQRDQKIVGPFGKGVRNDNGDKLVDFCKQHKVVIANTWFEQKESSRHTWTSPDGNIKNQIDFILVSQRFRNSIRNSKVRRNVDCGSDHDPVVMNIKASLKKIQTKPKTKKWNRKILEDDAIKIKFAEETDAQMMKTTKSDDSGRNIWNNLKRCITEVANDLCGKSRPEKKQAWITIEILDKMKKRSHIKNQRNKREKYLELCRDIQKSCRKAKERYYENKCMELEELDAKHRPELYDKIKEIKPIKHKAKLGLKSKDGKMLQNNQDIILRWQEYVTELYADSCRREAPNQIATTVETPILQKEVENTIKNLAKEKATGEDDIPAEFLQCCGPHCIEALTSVINGIYRTGILPDDFLTSVPNSKGYQSNKM